VFRGCDIGTDHFLLIAKIKLKTRWSKLEKEKHKKWQHVGNIYSRKDQSKTYQRRMMEYSKDFPPNENIEEEWRLI
jgi:hypothetical protein